MYDERHVYKHKKPHHILNLTLTVLTLGLWIPVWIIMSVRGYKTVEKVYRGAGGNVKTEDYYVPVSEPKKLTVLSPTHLVARFGSDQQRRVLVTAMTVLAVLTVAAFTASVVVGVFCTIILAAQVPGYLIGLRKRKQDNENL